MTEHLTPHSKQEDIIKSKVRFKIIRAGRRCVSGDTKILMSSGTYKPIKDILIGDFVFSYSESVEVKKVTNKYEYLDSVLPLPVLQLEVYDRENKKGTTSLTCTYNHKVYHQGKWVSVIELAWGIMENNQREEFKLLCEQYGETFDDRLLGSEDIKEHTKGQDEGGICKGDCEGIQGERVHNPGHSLWQDLEILKVIVKPSIDTYDIEVEDNHNYFIENEILIHNSGKSVLEIEDMVYAAVTGKDRNVFYLAPTQTQAREIIWLLLRKRLHGIGKFNEQRLEVIVPTSDGGQSMIKLSGWENRENFRGKSAYKLVFDEIDTMKDFFIGWDDIFRPTLIDTGGDATFIGTPKKENPNLKRLEKKAETDDTYETFHFTTFDNPHLPQGERDEIEKEYAGNRLAYRQEILAEHVEDAGALFNHMALVDVFSNTITKDGRKYLIVDIADDGTDKTIFSFWDGMEEYRREAFARLNTEAIIEKIREYAAKDRIPFSQIVVDAIGVGAGVASSSLLDGIIGFKSSYSPIKTDQDIVRLPNMGYVASPLQPLTSDYKNLRSQCVFTLADMVNNHNIASRAVAEQKEVIIEELSTYQDVSPGDGKRMATMKGDVKKIIGHSPDDSDTWIMRQYFVIRDRMLPNQTIIGDNIAEKMKNQFAINRENSNSNSNK